MAFVIAVIALLTTGAAHANLVVNGGFESPLVPAGSQYLLDATPTGWSGTGDMVLQSYGAVNSGEGNQWFDLNPNVNAGTGISQLIGLTLGESYSLSFVYNGGGGGSTTRIDFSIGTDLVDAVSTANLNVYGASPTPWKVYSAVFTATAASETLQFTPNGSWSGGFIDNVQVTEFTDGNNRVPDAAGTAALLVLSMVGTLGVGFRKARKD